MTNTDTAHLGTILHSGFEVVSNQICFSLLDQRARTNGMLELCAQHGVTVLAFGTLAGGFLTERWLAQPEPDWEALETWSQMKYGRFIREAGGWAALQDLLQVVHQVAERYNVSMANVAGRYILDQPAVGGIIILISGTTAAHGDRIIGGDDPASQTHFVIDKIEGALQSLGASLKDVVRTRIYLKNKEHLKPVADAHGLRFRGILPANTLICADIVGSEYLVEIEAEALLG